MQTHTTYAIIYPFGDSTSHKLFEGLTEALQFLDKESNLSYMGEKEGKPITILALQGTPQTIQSDIWDAMNEDDSKWSSAEDWLEGNAYLSESVNTWKIHENEKEEGGAITWSDENETYNTYEEAVEANRPSQFLLNF